MKEIKGNLWDYLGKPNHVLLITTNGTVKKDGTAVMGRGCAAQAKALFPGIDKKLGKLLKEKNQCWILRNEPNDIWSFPVKHNWNEKADLELIKKSVKTLNNCAKFFTKKTYILPKPGCGNGGLTWEEVKPLLEHLPDNVLVIDYE